MKGSSSGLTQMTSHALVRQIDISDWLLVSTEYWLSTYLNTALGDLSRIPNHSDTACAQLKLQT